MSESSRFVYATLQDIFKNVWEQQKYSELKNGAILTFNLAILAILARVYFYVAPTVNTSMLSKIIFFTLFIGFLLHIIFIIQSFFPKDSNKEDMKLTSDDINIFFFGDIQKVSSNKYLHFVMLKLNIKQVEESEIPLLLNLSNQIVKQSEITQVKYDAFKDAVKRLYFLTLGFVVYFSCLFFI